MPCLTCGVWGATHERGCACHFRVAAAPADPLGRIALYAALSLGAIVWISPVFLLVMTAVKSAAEFAHSETFALPRAIQWSNFLRAWEAGVRTYFMNSLVMTVVKVPIGVLIAAAAAFALSLMPMRGSRKLFGLFLVGLVVPVQMTLRSLTIMLRNLGLIDSLVGLFWLYLGFGLPFAILVLRGYMKTLPRELVEAALIDGCSWFGVFWRMALPLSRPAIVALLIFDGISTWNEFILAQIFLRSNSMRTLPLGLVNFQTEFSTAYELLAAAQCITIAPLVVVYLFFQRHFVHGLTGSVNGLTGEDGMTLPPDKLHRVILNTDAKNEADDQYAIVHALLTPIFDLHGIMPAHFGAKKSATSLKDSHDETMKLLDLMDLRGKVRVVDGATGADPGREDACHPPGARFIVEHAMRDDPRPLHVAFLGPLTDMAAAILIEPRIVARNVRVVWIGGGIWPIGGEEYNLSNDIASANVVFRSEIEIWQIPRALYRMMAVGYAELYERVYDKGSIGRYLVEQLVEWNGRLAVSDGASLARRLAGDRCDHVSGLRPLGVAAGTGVQLAHELCAHRQESPCRVYEIDRPALHSRGLLRQARAVRARREEFARFDG